MHQFRNIRRKIILSFTSLLGENSKSKLHTAEDATFRTSSDADCNNFIKGFHTALSWNVVLSWWTDLERLCRHFTAASCTDTRVSSIPITTWSIVDSVSMIWKEDLQCLNLLPRPRNTKKKKGDVNNSLSSVCLHHLHQVKQKPLMQSKNKQCNSVLKTRHWNSN